VPGAPADDQLVDVLVGKRSGENQDRFSTAIVNRHEAALRIAFDGAADAIQTVADGERILAISSGCGVTGTLCKAPRSRCGQGSVGSGSRFCGGLRTLYPSLCTSADNSLT
jgi:hypothetical protein